MYLVVETSGSKRWLLRTVVQGKRRDIGLGGATLVSLAEAREKALSMRKSARQGGDPLSDRKRANRVPPTFAEAVELVHAEHMTEFQPLAARASRSVSTLERWSVPAPCR